MLVKAVQIKCSSGSSSVLGNGRLRTPAEVDILSLNLDMMLIVCAERKSYSVATLLVKTRPGNLAGMNEHTYSYSWLCPELLVILLGPHPP